MFNAANTVSILVPMLVVVALTFVAFINMAAKRGGAMKVMNADYYRAHQGGQEPEAAAAAVRHFNILFEVPVLFYAACLTAYVLGAVAQWTLIFAWAFVAVRLVQSAVHMTYNNPAHRGGAFVVSMLALIALWVNVGMAVFARL